MTLAHRTCLNHEPREAVCQCPGCRNFFCRECVVLFQARLLCAGCLRTQTAAQQQTPERSAAISSFTLAIIGLLLVWFVFYLVAWTIVQFRHDRAVSTATVRALA